MNCKKKKLIQLAYSLYKKIRPCGGRKTFYDCFTTVDDELLFWFDTEDNNTHMIKSSMAEEIVDDCRNKGEKSVNTAVRL